MQIAQAMQRLRETLAESPEMRQQHLEWLIQYRERGGDASHVAAGEGLAAAVLTAAILQEDRALLETLLYNDRPDTGKEVFRFLFARIALHEVLQSYYSDNMSCPRGALDRLDVSVGRALHLLLQNLAFDAGEIALRAGFSVQP